MSLTVGNRVRFSEDRKWWDVRAAEERFAVLTRQADFCPKGERFYTVVDQLLGVRGGINLIGGGYDTHMEQPECDELLTEVRTGKLEISRRRRLPLNIKEVSE